MSFSSVIFLNPFILITVRHGIVILTVWLTITLHKKSIAVKYVFWKRLFQTSCCLQFFMSLRSVLAIQRTLSQQCVKFQLFTLPCGTVAFKRYSAGDSNMQSASFSVPCPPQAESYLSDHFGINLFWRERRQLPVNSCMIVATMRFEPLKAALFKAKNSYTKRLIVHEIIPPLATKFVTSSKLCAFRELLTWFFKHDQKLKKLRITATRTWESQSHLTFVIHSVTAADSSDARISKAFKTENSEQNKRMR